jgi:hypothetical protein
MRAPLTKTWNRILNMTMVVYLVFSILFTALYFFSCKPISAAWDLDVRVYGYYYIDATALIQSVSGLYAVGDIWLLILPIWTVIHLKFNWQKKVGLVFVFAIGGIACAASVLKFVTAARIYKSFDPTWRGISFVYGTLFESSLGIIGASLPALHSSIISLLPKTWHDWYNYGKKTPLFVSMRSTGWSKYTSKTYTVDENEMASKESVAPDLERGIIKRYSFDLQSSHATGNNQRPETAETDAAHELESSDSDDASNSSIFIIQRP